MWLDPPARSATPSQPVRELTAGALSIVFWGRAWVVVLLAACAGGFVFGLERALTVLAAVGFLGALAGLRWRPLGLLSVSVLCTLDPVVRLLLMRGGFLRFNTLNYVALLALVVFPRTLARWRNAQVRLLVVLIFILTIGLLFSPGRELGVQHLLNLVSLLGILVYLRRAGSSSKNWLWLGLVGGLSAACVGALFYLQSSKIDYVNSNAWVYVPLGGMLTVCLAAAAGKPRRLRALTLASIAIVNAMWVLLSGSRGGLLVAIVCVCFLLVTLKDAQVRLAMVLAGGMAVLAMGAWFADQELNMLDKISTLLDSSRSASKRTDGHFDLALGGWNVFVRHPLGVGTGGFAPTWAELGSRENVLAFRSGHEMQAHSAWIKTLAENGVLGFLCLAVWVASFLWIGWRSGRKNAFRLGAFVTVALTTAFLSTEFSAKGLWLMAGGATILLARKRRNPTTRIQPGAHLFIPRAGRALDSRRALAAARLPPPEVRQ